MIKNLYLMLVLLTALVLAACSAVGKATTNQAGEQAAGGQPVVETGTSNSRQMPLEMQLALGTFKLDETQYPIDAEQAAKLLPLWKAARSLSQNETAAPEEIQAVLRQIQEALTPEQMQAVEEMNLTFEDMRTISTELGLDLAPGGGMGNMDPERMATARAAGAGGQGPPPDGGQFMGPGGPGGPGGGGGGFDLQARQTAIAEGGRRGAMPGMNPALLNAIIEFLEAKVP